MRYWLCIFFTNLFKITAADPMIGTMDKDIDKRLELIFTMFLVANMMEDVERNVLANVVVRVDDKLSTSFAKIDCMAAGECDKLL
mmetsp:Transcript_24990/g.30738  ORF Transcript_24990/g.30738 Transcript_24990/m.30738 type:complete len:85 (+) Transcript_24990:1523-1777(+)